MDLLTEILTPARPTAVVDVGTNPIDGDPPYRAMLAAGLCAVTDFEPQPGALALCNLSPIWGTVKQQIPVTTRKLDDIAQIAHLDFLKMDVQGAEREVLAHGRAKLADAVVIQTEVSFVPLYRGQPVFGEIDLALPELGFLPHCVTGTKIWPIAPMVVGDAPNRGTRQLLETDMVYVRDFSRPGNMSAVAGDANKRYLASLRKSN
jgi:hypothetical protein